MVSPPCTKRTADVRICTPSFFPVSVMMTPALSFLLNRPVLWIHVIIDSNEKTRIMRVEIDEEAGRLYCLDVMRQCRSDENAIRSARLIIVVFKGHKQDLPRISIDFNFRFPFSFFHLYLVNPATVIFIQFDFFDIAVKLF